MTDRAGVAVTRLAARFSPPEGEIVAVRVARDVADRSITGTDWFFLVAAMSSPPRWSATADPTWDVVVLTVVDLLGFGPTVRKVYADPHSESLAFFRIVAARKSVVVRALEHDAVATVLFPATIAVACMLLVFLILYRRRIVSATAR